MNLRVRITLDIPVGAEEIKGLAQIAKECTSKEINEQLIEAIVDEVGIPKEFIKSVSFLPGRRNLMKGFWNKNHASE